MFMPHTISYEVRASIRNLGVAEAALTFNQGQRNDVALRGLAAALFYCRLSNDALRSLLGD
jgi:hypothetical protein